MRRIRKLWNRFLFWLDHYRKIEVKFSLDETLYYIPKYCVGRRGRYWLSVEKFPVAIKDEPSRTFEGGILIEKTNGESYCRRRLPFVFWSVKSGKSIQVCRADDLVADFRCSAEVESHA